MPSKKKAKPKLLGFKYLGGGYYYVQGLPARDVSAEEIENQLQRWGGVEAFAKYPHLYEAHYAPEKKPEPEPTPEVVVEPETEVVLEDDKE